MPYFVRSGVTKLVNLCDTWGKSVTPHTRTSLRAVFPKEAQLPAGRGGLRYFENPSFLLDNSLCKSFQGHGQKAHTTGI